MRLLDIKSDVSIITSRKKTKKPSERFLFLTGERTRIENAWTNQPPFTRECYKVSSTEVTRTKYSM